MEDIKAIRNYILLLKTHHHLSVTLHPLKAKSLIFASELIRFNIHDNSYCVFLKSCEEAKCHCILRQPKLLQKLDEVPSFEGVCYAGVREYVYPIFDGKENIGFVSVSGYQSDGSESYLERVAKQYRLDKRALQEAYDTLNTDLPPKEYVDTLLLPLCRMLELVYRKIEQMPKAEWTLPEKVVAYLKMHRNETITSEDICKEFYCSRAYMSSQFNRFTGMSIREYINTLRIGDAKLLLKNSKLSMTEIALSVGYSDSNYFSNVFKKITGVSPMKYRRAHRAQ